MESCVWCYITTGCIMLLIQSRLHPPAISCISCLTALGSIDHMLHDMCNPVSQENVQYVSFWLLKNTNTKFYWFSAFG